MRKGINYEVGPFTRGKDLPVRELFDASVVRQEMDIIKNDLHAIPSGSRAMNYPGFISLRNMLCSRVWSMVFAWADWRLREGNSGIFKRVRHNGSETAKVFFECFIFVLGSELTVFMSGFIEGRTPFDRIKTLMKPARLMKNTLLKGP